jgi:hypothetical protein
VNFGELKTAILADTHRSDLTAHVARFVRLGEGLIARRMQAWEVDTTFTLDDTDRAGVEFDLYTLPSGILQIRRIVLATADGEGYPLTPAGPNFVALIRRACAPFYYAVLGNRLQVRGVPAEDAELELDCRGRLAALSDDGDTNAVLTAHEALYMHASKHYLYDHTQDLELKAEELGSFNDVVDQLNEEAGRKLGNAGAAPAYDFGGGGGY